MPKTADDVPIVPEMTVYLAAGDYVMGRTALAVTSEGFTALHGGLTGQHVETFRGDRFYSTKAAAFAASDADRQTVIRGVRVVGRAVAVNDVVEMQVREIEERLDA